MRITSLPKITKKVEDSHVESRVVSNLYQEDVKINTRLVSKSAPNDTEDNETYLSEYTSSRKSSKNSKEFSSSTRADNISSIENPKNILTLNIILSCR